MNLKEAFNYQNCLRDWITEAEAYLYNTDFVTTTTEVHHRSKANPDATDEEITVPKPENVSFGTNDVIDFMVEAIREKEKLTYEINETKKVLDIDIDGCVSINKTKQNFMEILKSMNKIKPSEEASQGVDYRFDINDEQKKYYYDITEKTTIDFDRNDVRKLYKKYKKETDEVSAQLELALISTDLVFNPRWDAGDTLSDILDNA